MIKAPISTLDRLKLSLPGLQLSNDLGLALKELLEFVEHFRGRNLEGMSEEKLSVAGEVRKITLKDDSVDEQSLDVIVVNGRTYVPETVEAEEEGILSEVLGFLAEMSALYHHREGYEPMTLHPVFYELLEAAGARMDSFERVEK